jgi:hypothetical protein
MTVGSLGDCGILDTHRPVPEVVGLTGVKELIRGRSAKEFLATFQDTSQRTCLPWEDARECITLSQHIVDNFRRGVHLVLMAGFPGQKSSFPGPLACSQSLAVTGQLT